MNRIAKLCTVVALTLFVASPTSAQVTEQAISGGIVRLTQIASIGGGPAQTFIEFLLRDSFGPNNPGDPTNVYATLPSVDLQAFQPLGSTMVFFSAALIGDVQRVESPVPGEVDSFGTDAADVVHLTLDGGNYAPVSSSCTPVPPSGGTTPPDHPYWGSVESGIGGYYDTCAPDSYVDLSFTFSHVELLAPEPSSLAMLLPGLAVFAVAGSQRRVRRRIRTSC